MKTIKYIFILPLFLGFYTQAHCQMIIAGQHSSSDYYYKFIPDTIAINIPGNTGNTDYYSFDINNDGVKDFKFALQAPTTAMGANSSFCSIIAMNNNKVALASYDSCFDNSGTLYIAKYGVAHAFKYNDTINSNLSWDSLVYLTYGFSHFSNPGYSCGASYSPDTAYIGVRVMVNSSYEYGWIRIVSMTFNPTNPTTLKMGALACENNSAGINEALNNNYSVKIYPNPANELIN